MKKLIILTSILFVQLLSSCVDVDAIQINKVDKFSIISASKIELGVEVNNNSKSTIKMKSAKLKLYQQSNHILTLMVNDQIVIKKRSVESVNIPIHMKLVQPLSAMLLLSNLSEQKESLIISGEAVVQLGIIVKKIKFKEMPLSQFIDNFGDNITF